MKRNSSLSYELQLCRYKGGIKLIPPNEDNKIFVGDLLKQSFNVFIQDLDLNIIDLNEACWSSCGFSSREDALGENIKKVCTDTVTVSRMQYTNQSIIQRAENVVVNENVPFSDGSELRTISFKFPWYDENNKVKGLVGFALDLSKNDLAGVANDLNYLNTNFLDQHTYQVSSVKYNLVNKYQLTPREIDVVDHIMRGKTLRATAEKLNLSTRTVEAYLESIKSKTSANSKSQLIEILYDYYK